MGNDLTMKALVCVTLILLLIRTAYGGDAICPQRCRCQDNFTKISCTKKSLFSIPKDIPASVKHLDLSNNLIQTIKKDDLRRLTKLEFLVFTSNKLNSIEPGSFSDLSSLKRIYLGKNRLIHIPEPEGMVALEYFIMETNALTEIVFPAGFLNLTRLKRITLTENRFVTNLTHNSFESLKNSRVSRLYLSKCSISTITNDTFEPLKNVASLQLSYNPIDGDQLANALSGFNGSKHLLSLKLSGLKFDGKFPNGAFSILKKSPIRLIDFSHNVIRIVSEGAFNGLPNLANLNLRACLVDTIHEKAFSDLITLKELNLKNNSLTSVPKYLPDSLTSLDLSWNSHIRVLKKDDFVTLKHLRSLFLNENYLLELQDLTFAGLHKVETLDLSGNKLPYLPKNIFGPMKQRLKFLRLNHNTLASIPDAKTSPFSSLDKLAYLDMSDNSCKRAPTDMFKGLVKLQNLYLNNNKFGTMLELEKYSHMFNDLTSLKELNLQNNDIRNVRPELFQNLPKVTKINLRDNKLSHWSTNLFRGVPLLSHFDVSSNLISLINSTSVQDFKNNLQLNLTGNPFACTCDLLWFRQWMNTTTISLTGQTGYMCNSPRKLQNLPLLQWFPKQIDCINEVPYILGGSLVGTVLLMTIVGFIMYRKRWFIRLYIYKLKHVKGDDRQGYQRIDGQDGIAYDAFLSFCDDDSEWVSDTFMKFFDKQESGDDSLFDLCLADRDFLPYLTTAGSIYEAIENSKRFILVISNKYPRHFQFSGRCELELHCALDKQMVDEFFEIIIVLKDNPPLEHIPKRVRYLYSDPEERMRADWPSGNVNGQELFVCRLKDMLERESVGSLLV